ncbi:MAG: polysaccharide biosynthesis C-terminal domain-containing protein [bacterium]
MSIKRRLLTSSLINAFGHFTLLLASFFSLPILISALGTSVFGQYILLIGIPAFAGLFDLGFGNGSLYYLSKDSNNNNWQNILGSNLFATIPMVLAAGLIAYFGIGKNLFGLMAFLVLVNQLSDIIMILAQSKNNYSIFNLKVIIVGLGNTLFSAFVARATHSLESVILTQIGFQMLLLVFAAIWVKWIGYSLRPKLNRKMALSTLLYGFSTLGSSVAGQLQAQTSRYYLSYIFSSAATGIYGLAQSLVQKGLTLIQVTGRSFFATSANLHGESRYATIKRIYLTSIAVVVAIGACAVIATHYIGYPIILWWLQDASLAGQVYPVLVVLSYWFLSVSLTPLTSYIGMGIGEGKLVSIFAISSVTLELILMFILTPRMGLVGPAYAALISSYLHTPPFLYLLWKKISAKV